MRHSDYRTTLKHYTVLSLADTARAIEQLPLLDLAPRTAADSGNHRDEAGLTADESAAEHPRGGP
jgi:hypothetical protein